MTLFMLVFLFFLLTGLVLARLNTAYHPDLILKRHIEIKNEKIARLLICGNNPADAKVENAEENRNKILYLGIAFYLLWIAVVVCSAILLFFVPKIEIASQLVFDEISFSVRTLNEKISFLFLFELNFAEVVFLCLNMTNCEKSVVQGSKFLKCLWKGVVAFLFVCLIATPFVFWFNL